MPLVTPLVTAARTGDTEGMEGDPLGDPVTDSAMDSATDSRSARESVLARLARSGSSPLMSEFPHGALFAFDTDLRVLAVGGSVLEVVGMSREALEGHTLSEVLPPETADLIEGEWRRVLAGHAGSIDFPYAGRIFQHELAPVTVDGEIVAGMGFVQDVTDARAAQRALADSDERQRLLLEHAPIGMAVVGLDGRFLQVNPALCRMLGHREDDLLRLTFQEITHPDDLDADLTALHQLIDGTIDSFESEKRYVTADGTVLWVLLSVALVRDVDGSPLHFVSQILDISERKRQHDALRDLTSMMAHDLRGPLGAMAGLMNVLQSTWHTRSDDERLAIVRRVAETARLTSGLLENTLTASTIDAQRLSAHPERVVVADALRVVLATVPHDATDVTVHGDPAVGCWVDHRHLVQTLTNLVGNAVKYGGAHVGVDVREADGWTTVRVADDGPGIAPAFVPHLFDRYSRSAEARLSGRTGSGLGLAIVRDLVRLNGGEVTYAPVEPTGAAFTVRLPAAPPA